MGDEAEERHPLEASCAQCLRNRVAPALTKRPLAVPSGKSWRISEFDPSPPLHQQPRQLILEMHMHMSIDGIITIACGLGLAACEFAEAEEHARPSRR